MMKLTIDHAPPHNFGKVEAHVRKCGSLGITNVRSILIGFHTITYYDTITVLGITPA
jgi:hypothetical protein